MTPFSPATPRCQPVREFIQYCMQHGATRKEAKEVYREMKRGKVFKNDTYQVWVADYDGMTHLSIKRIDKQPIHDWRDLQEIKNQLTDPEHEAIELYPG